MNDRIKELIKQATSYTWNGDGVTEELDPELLEALEESNSLLVAMLHEERPKSEIMDQISDNRKLISKATGPRYGFV